MFRRASLKEALSGGNKLEFAWNFMALHEFGCDCIAVDIENSFYGFKWKTKKKNWENHKGVFLL